jgi:alpha-mannosidase
MKLQLSFWGSHKIIKLVIPSGGIFDKRRDAVPGGTIKRGLDGREYPVYGHLSLAADDGSGMAAVSWDTFSGDVQPDGTMRLTMLRTPLYAHHPPFDTKAEFLYPVMDQGEHEYELSMLTASSMENLIMRERTRLRNPIIMRETTRGMGGRHEY